MLTKLFSLIMSLFFFFFFFLQIKTSQPLISILLMSPTLPGYLSLKSSSIRTDNYGLPTSSWGISRSPQVPNLPSTSERRKTFYCNKSISQYPASLAILLLQALSQLNWPFNELLGKKQPLCTKLLGKR